MQDKPPADPLPGALRVLIIEDDEQFRLSVKRSLELAGHEVRAFADAESALEHLNAVSPAAILTDLRLPRANGMFVLDRARERRPDIPVVLMTGHGDIPTAIQAIRAGAYDFLEKPFNREQLLAVVLRACEQHRLVSENKLLKDRLAAASGIDQILRGDAASLRELRDLVLRLAPTPVDVLVQGETGTGKELVARCLHDYGKRSGNFVAVNCAAIPENLFESELFGNEAGAFTGAGKLRIGKIEYAREGTLFLDEIEAMPLPLQAKLLRVLQEREVERLGGNRPVAVNFRVVAATKVSLLEMSRKGTFRPDLFYRLNVASVTVSPLRSRLGDIPGLFQAFLQEASLRYQLPAQALTAEQHQALLAHSWPGNVRELKATAERLTLSLPMFVDGDDSNAPPRSFDESVAMIERSLLEASLRRNAGSVKDVCAELQMSTATIYRKLKTLGLEPSNFKSSDAESA